jgi:hypothetical protein
MPEGKVNVSLGVTLNMANFEFARIDVGITLPFDASSTTDREKVYHDAIKWTEEKLKEEKQKIGR